MKKGRLFMLCLALILGFITFTFAGCSLFGTNNEFDASGNSTNNNGSNYIKLNFAGANNGNFQVNFRGLYDKV